MVKRIGGLMFLIGTIAMIVMAFMYRADAPHVWMEVCAAVALVGVILTRSKGIWVWIIGVVLTYVGAKGFIANTTVNTESSRSSSVEPTTAESEKSFSAQLGK